MAQARVMEGDALDALRGLDAGSVECCFTSPPYWPCDGASAGLGTEPDPARYAANLAAVFREVRRVLTASGTLWLVIGGNNAAGRRAVGVPWAVALALQADGWTLHKDVIWDDGSGAHHYVFLFAKSAEIHVDPSQFPGDVWRIPSERPPQGYRFSLTPEPLVERCLLSSTREGHTLLDPFCGSGTAGIVARRHGRNFIGIEVDPGFAAIARRRLEGDAVPQGLPADPGVRDEPIPHVEPDAWVDACTLQIAQPPQDASKLAALAASMRKDGWTGRPVVVVGRTAWTGPHRITAAGSVGIRVPVVRLEEGKIRGLEELVANHGGPRFGELTSNIERFRYLQVAMRVTGDASLARATALLRLEDLAEWLDGALRESPARLPALVRPGRSAGILPSCSKPPEPERVYAIGRLGYELPTEARRDSFPPDVEAYLRERPEAAADLVWTLAVDGVVVDAIRPAGPFAAEAYRFLIDALSAPLLTVPGHLAGTVTLRDGQCLPVIVPSLREMHLWTLEPTEPFVDRLLYELRNRGRTPSERAMNFAATQADRLGEILRHAAQAGLALETIGAERSPICRPKSDCWDVKFTFFDPARRLERARRVYRLTVDVSEEIPVTIGPVRHWDVD